MTKQEAKELYLPVVKDALIKLSSVPDDKFITGTFTNYRDACCAIGHYCRLSGNPDSYTAINCMPMSFSSDGIKQLARTHLIQKLFIGVYNLADANNGSFLYDESKSAKGRSILFLNIVKRAIENNKFKVTVNHWFKDVIEV